MALADAALAKAKKAFTDEKKQLQGQLEAAMKTDVKSEKQYEKEINDVKQSLTDRVGAIEQEVAAKDMEAKLRDSKLAEAQQQLAGARRRYHSVHGLQTCFC